MRPAPTIYHPDNSGELGLVRETLHLLLREVRELKEMIMAAVDDFNAKLDEIQGKVTKIGADLANEVLLLQQAGAGQGGISATDAAALMTRLGNISNSLTTLDVTTPPATPTA